ncbi:GNAT family N-acetyltransferase [Thalassotalea profundi]|uniref:GCN5 family N-acetyltransferase n=1 Tax=Thalassotalea profundi TaxID=2036687 RepID=A0ABQ3IAT0_9GAMM|nr:GNAT family protein [Thalassotalea profundi]GHE77233.1 GCN5 family N-acetyltransferase [Thalassotalea profundi]
MDNLDKFQNIIVGKVIKLIPLSLLHKSELVAASSDGNLSELWFTNVPNEKTIDQYIDVALSGKSKGIALPFVVQDIASGKIVGSTRLCNIDIDNRRAEIGYTWYAKSYQRSGVNTDCKLLMLSLAFEQLNAIAVEFRTHYHNHVSRTAIARLGAKQDGILRNHRIHPDGELRDTVVFSIIESEWPLVKKSLLFKQSQYLN